MTKWEAFKARKLQNPAIREAYEAARSTREIEDVTLTECHASVTRDGTEEPCEKPAVALVAFEHIDGRPWPACAYHANRWGPCVPLADIVRIKQAQALREAGAAIGDGHDQEWLHKRADDIARGDEHCPWTYTEVGVRCSCGSWMDRDERCPDDFTRGAE